MPGTGKHWIIPGIRYVRITRHARERMKQRRVSEQELIEALRNPLEHAYDKANDVYIAFNGSVAVVYAYHPPVIEIVTVLREKEYRHLVKRLSNRRYKLIRQDMGQDN